MAKRRNSAADASDVSGDENAPLTRSELDDLLETRSKSMLDTLSNVFKQEQAKTLHQYDTLQTKKFERMGNEIKGLKEPLSVLEGQQRATQSTVEELKVSVAIADEAVYEPLEMDDEWDFVPYLEVLFINTADWVSKATLSKYP